VGALRGHAYDPAGELAVDVTAEGRLAPLDPEVEAAAYRIALEAVTNARRHAHATDCTVALSADDGQLRIEVRDDGRGMPAVPREGVGLAVARRIVSFYSGAHQRYAAQAFPDLTPRERDVLDLLAAGARNHEIARRLGLSEKTVRNHVSALRPVPARGAMRTPDVASELACVNPHGCSDARAAPTVADLGCRLPAVPFVDWVGRAMGAFSGERVGRSPGHERSHT